MLGLVRDYSAMDVFSNFSYPPQKDYKPSVNIVINSAIGSSLCSCYRDHVIVQIYKGPLQTILVYESIHVTSGF